MTNRSFLDDLRTQTDTLRDQGLYKAERTITSPQQAWIEADGRRVLNLCANNYLGLSNHPALVEAAREALPKYGFGLSSVRFICGTQSIHRELEEKLVRIPRHRSDDSVFAPASTPTAGCLKRCSANRTP